MEQEKSLIPEEQTNQPEVLETSVITEIEPQSIEKTIEKQECLAEM